MRPLHALFCLPAVLAFVPLASRALGRAQDPETPPAEKKAGLGSHLDSERDRIQEALAGVWMLVRYDPPNGLDPQNVHGVLMFRDGFLSLNLIAQQMAGQFFGPDVQVFVQGGAHRYRIDDFGRLQTSSLMSFHNFDDWTDIELEPSGSSREYAISLDEGGETLKLTKADGALLTFIKLQEAEFPTDSVDALNRARGSGRPPPTDD